jgi:hypothetical protein
MFFTGSLQDLYRRFQGASPEFPTAVFEKFRILRDLKAAGIARIARFTAFRAFEGFRAVLIPRVYRGSREGLARVSRRLFIHERTICRILWRFRRFSDNFTSSFASSGAPGSGFPEGFHVPVRDPFRA